MKTVSVLVLSIVIALMVIQSVCDAVPPGRRFSYKGGGAGKVVFDSKDHMIKGNNCITCHPDIFVMRKKITITMADIYANKYCGVCHNGSQSFDARNQKNCTMCHKK